MIDIVSKNAAQFDDHIPLDFQRDLVRMIVNQCRLSHDRCFGSRAYPEAHYLWPHQRRADIEGGVRELAIRYGLTTRPEPFDNNGEFYTVVETNRVFITFSHVPERYVLPRTAKARETAALEYQDSLFPTLAPPPTDAKLYAIVTYGGSNEENIAPAFIDVVFPSGDYTRIVDRIPLMDRFRDELGGDLAEVNDIPDSGGPTIRELPQTEA